MPSLPLKDWLYGGAIIVLMIAFGLYTNHERGIGADKIKAQDAKLSAAAVQHSLDVAALADKKTTTNGDHYVAAINAPIPDSPRVVCKRTITPVVMPETPNRPGLLDGAADSAKADSIDIGAPLDKIGRDADAKITALQNEIRILVDAMNGVTAP